MPPIKRAMWIFRHRKPQAVIAIALLATLALVVNTSGNDRNTPRDTAALSSQDTQSATLIDMESTRPQTGQGQE